MSELSPLQAVALSRFDLEPFRDLLVETDSEPVEFGVRVTGLVTVGSSQRFAGPLPCTPWSIIAVLLARHRVNFRQVVEQASRRNAEVDSADFHGRIRLLTRPPDVLRRGPVSGDVVFDLVPSP